MAVRKTWKYEKDIVSGKRFRKYFLENIFGADVADMQTFRILKTKLSRDYIGFFQHINKSYQKGEFKKEAKIALSLTLSTINILENMIDSGIIDGDAVSTVVDNIKGLNEYRNFFVTKSKEVAALKTRLESIQEETGISPESLNITKKIIEKGVKREKKKLKEGTGSFLQRTMPRSFALGGELAAGLGVAALGPFFPLAQAAGGLAKDIFGLGKGLVQKVGEKRERRLGTKLSSFAHGLSREELSKMFPERGTGYSIPKGVRKQVIESSKVPRSVKSLLRRERKAGRVRPPLREEVSKTRQEDFRESIEKETPGILGSFSKIFKRDRTRPGMISRAKQRKASVSVLRDFFDKGAYKAKWTKELLKRIKEVGKGGRSGGLLSLFGLTNKFKALGAAILPFIGKAGLFAVAAVTTAKAISEIDKAIDRAKKLAKVKEEGKRVARRAEESRSLLAEKIKKEPRGLFRAAKSQGRSVAEFLRRQAEERIREQELKRAALPWHKRMFAPEPESKLVALERIAKEFGAKDIAKLVHEEIEKRKSRISPATSAVASAYGAQNQHLKSLHSSQVELASELKNLNEAINKLAEQQERGNEPPVIREGNMGNPYDSSDDLLKEYSKGTLTMED